MDAVNFLHHENPPTWAESNPQTWVQRASGKPTTPPSGRLKGRLKWLRGENVSRAAEIVNGVYGANTVTTNHVQFWFHRFRSGIFDVKNASRIGRPVVENVAKITEIIEVDRHVSCRSIVQELKIDHKKGFKPFTRSWIQ
ncbi:histone-lysine N-methyltransferase SETMAR [Trichonephila clavipes]|nr:histone-lysine N-methyltransferase SETMAR [Trichonephila clavipes]